MLLGEINTEVPDFYAIQEVSLLGAGIGMDPERLAVHCIAWLGEGKAWSGTELWEERVRGAGNAGSREDVCSAKYAAELK